MKEYIRLEDEKAHRHGKAALTCEPKVSPLNYNEIDFRISFDESDDKDYAEQLVSKNGYDVLDMALPPRDQRDQYLRFKGLEYIDADITNFEERLGDKVGWIQCILGRDCEADPRQRGSECLLGRDLICEDFFGTAPSYTSIRDLILMLCQRLIACGIVGRSQAPEKICEELDNSWAWVASGLERQQASQPPPAAGPTRIMAQRIARFRGGCAWNARGTRRA
nr:hypothetical protein [Tanacetum cinerariifolium]